MLQSVQKAKEFFECWKTKDWQRMYCTCQITWREDKRNTVQYLFELYPADLLQFTLGMKVHSSSDSGLLVRIPFTTVMHLGGNITTKSGLVVMVKEIGAYIPSKKGTWGVNPISVLRGKVL